MKSTIALATLLFSLSATAGEQCPSSLPDHLPALPDGSVATEEAMFEAQAAYQDYVTTIERYLECYSLLISDATHNMLLDRAVFAAARYNDELKAYRAHQDLVAQN